MLTFFISQEEKVVYALKSAQELTNSDIEKCKWLFRNPDAIQNGTLKGKYIGPRSEMVTPWSTNAVEITQNMGMNGIERIEMFREDNGKFDPMLEMQYKDLTQNIFDIKRERENPVDVDNLEAYNEQEGLALNAEEIRYLKYVSKKIGRKLTDSEVFGFSQVNSEHCRHKIFNGKFIINDVETEKSLFDWIKRTSKENPNFLVSAYKDNVAFIEGPEIDVFTPKEADKASEFYVYKAPSVISLKAETHNFPTTVEPFYGASTGSGGEIRDRMAGGKGSIPVAGTAVYMTSLPRVDDEEDFTGKPEERPFLYQSPADILIKASNGASDFGNKFGQPLICGSVFTFEHQEDEDVTAYDKVIMLAGGIGYALKSSALKDKPDGKELLIMMGGDNYRIGMGGGAVSSVNTGQYANKIELNAIQRANPEMQKRVFNVIRAFAESENNPIVSIHDHGAGGHLNCFSELMEDTGGVVYLDKLPVGDPSLSAKEIIGNESQERMGLLLRKKQLQQLQDIADRERAPVYVAGECKGNHKLVFQHDDNDKPFNLKLEYLFGNTPDIEIRDRELQKKYKDPVYELSKFKDYMRNILRHEAVACKDWLTNKVDRSVTGRIAMQQTCGSIQLPLNNAGIIALDYTGTSGVATSIGHASSAGLIDPEKASRLSVAEALTNIIWAPLKDGIKSVSLSANWMWPSGNPGEDARLYRAVKAISDFCVNLGINIPTGKDSLSMTQKYPDGKKVLSPGTVIVSAAAEVTDVKKAISPVLQTDYCSTLIYINFSKSDYKLGGSAFFQTLNAIGSDAPDVQDPEHFVRAFNAVQSLIQKDKIIAGHDIGAGGMMTSLLEMCFPNPKVGLDINISRIPETDIPSILFAENPGILIQVRDPKKVVDYLYSKSVDFHVIGKILKERVFKIIKNNKYEYFDIDTLRDVWYRKSFLMDKRQSGDYLAERRYENYKNQPLEFKFPTSFKGKIAETKEKKVKAAIIREKGVNGDREMAYSMFEAGMNVKDVHMTDLIAGRETLEDVNMIVFVGGFSHSDVLGSAKGWAAGFLYNEKARKALDNFYARPDTLSLGVCNGCQVVTELGVLFPEMKEDHPKMHWNDSHKFESGFVSVDIPENNSVMLSTLKGSTLGVWIAHGEGKFVLPRAEDAYNIPMKYSYGEYPGNPNGSDFNAAAICSADGRHLAMMPHIERSVFPWQWAHYPTDRIEDKHSPWIEAFVNARKWIEKNRK